MDGMLTTWQDVCFSRLSYVSRLIGCKVGEVIDPYTFPNLKLLSLSSNALQTISVSQEVSHPNVESVLFDNNGLRCLEDLRLLFNAFPKLAQLSLQENRIERVWTSEQQSGNQLSRSLQTLNLSRNAIHEWSVVDQLPAAFPSMQSLRISNNPLYMGISPTNADASSKQSVEETSYMLTLARLGNLRTLNYSVITPQDRLNGELYYLASIEREHEASIAQGKSLTPDQINSRHPRYSELCRIYDRLPIGSGTRDELQKAKPTGDIEALPGSLASRLVRFSFIAVGLVGKMSTNTKTKVALELGLPRTISTYSLKALLVRELGLQPLDFRLIYESEEMDPVAETMITSSVPDGAEDSDVDWDVDPQTSQGLDIEGSQDNDHPNANIVASTEHEGKKWKRREVEMLDSTRDIGFWLDDNAKEAMVRIELLSH